MAQNGTSGASAGAPRAVPCSASVFEAFPAGTSPLEVGKRVAENFVARSLSHERQAPIHYAEACAWYGGLVFANLTADAALEARLVRKFAPLLTSPGSACVPARAHVDDRVFGIAPLQIYRNTASKAHLLLGQGLADAQWQSPTPDGITREARYWVDDIYMITSLQVQAYRATRNTSYRDRAALTVATYLEQQQQPSGLFFHTPRSPRYWARGNGWAAAGMTELLSELPASHPLHARILAGYRAMMAALLAQQDSQGVWHELIDEPSAWVETSGTGMFAFALVTGVKQGWLDAATYADAARKAWLGLVGYLDEAGSLKGVCIGTGEAHTTVGADGAAQIKYYLERETVTGDMHGQAPVLWSACALLSRSPLATEQGSPS